VNRDQILELLAHSKPTLVERFGVTNLALFDSISRGTARQDSDVDILVSFDGPATFECYFVGRRHLCDRFCRAPAW
jgi:predicted nucleotidyltransferase